MPRGPRPQSRSQARSARPHTPRPQKRRRQVLRRESLHRAPKNTPDASRTSPPEGFPAHTAPSPKTFCRARLIVEPSRPECNQKIASQRNFLWISFENSGGPLIGVPRASHRERSRRSERAWEMSDQTDEAEIWRWETEGGCTGINTQNRVPARRRQPTTTAVNTVAPRKRRCQWPIGEPGDANFRFCEKAALAKVPYCAEHSARAYIDRR